MREAELGDDEGEAEEEGGSKGEGGGEIR